MPRSTKERLRVVVTGLIGSYPVAGLVAHYLQYPLGFKALGHDVLYLEDTGWYYDPRTEVYVDAWRPATGPARQPSAALAEVMEAHGLGDRWTYVTLEGERTGVSGVRLQEFLSTADIFVHVTGAGVMRDEYLSIPVRVYVDTDPGYVQMRTANGSPKDLLHLQHHTAHLSFGTRLGASDCSIPTLGLEWRPTVQPVYLPLWDRVAGAESRGDAFTTVLKWNPYEPVRYQGRVFGMKDVEFLRFWDLPRVTSQTMELSMEGEPPLPEEDLRAAGWRVRDARAISGSLDDYRSYIEGSRAEWSVAKHGYVATRSGWFSERSAVYLACGRPVVLQDTGFSEWMETGTGALAFSTLEEAAAGIDDVNGRYEEHRTAAREIAAAHFDSRRVLTELIESAHELSDRSVSTSRSS